MQKALALEVAREKGMSPEKVNAICKSFHDALRQMMSQPDNCKGGIIINNFLALSFKEAKLDFSIDLNKDFIELKKQVRTNIKKNRRTNANKATYQKEQTSQERHDDGLHQGESHD